MRARGGLVLFYSFFAAFKGFLGGVGFKAPRDCYSVAGFQVGWGVGLELQVGARFRASRRMP